MSFDVAGNLLDLQGMYLPNLDHNIGTITEARIAYVPHKALSELADAYPGIRQALSRHILVDSAIFREWLVGMGQRSALQRIAHLFCELY